MIVQTPIQRFTGKLFEQVLVARHNELKKDGVASIGRYGVQATRTKTDWVILQSLPDFEGDVKGGGVVTNSDTHIIFDAKVCSQASFDLSKYRSDTKGARRRQLSHMYDRSEYGAVCFFLIHWNERILRTKKESAETYLFPVWIEHPFWQSFERGEVKSLNRQDCNDYGERVPWTIRSKARTARPDWLSVAVPTLQGA